MLTIVHFGPHDGSRGNYGAFLRARYDRLDGDIPEDRGAYFSGRDLPFGGADSWLASHIVGFD